MSLKIPADEEAEIRERFWQIKQDDVVIDVGSFLGTYTLPALAAGATVHAIDARASTLADLLGFATESKLADRLTPVHAALFDGGQYPDGLLTAIMQSPVKSSRDMTPDQGVLWTTLDKFAVLPRVDWVKIDVEGGELGVIEGGLELLRVHQPSLLIEDHSRVYSWVAEQHSTAGILQLLHEFGYDSQLVVEDHVDYIVGTPR